jgi:cysteine-rich repeat protein
MLVGPGPAWAWRTSLAETDGNSRAFAVGIDRHGDVLVAGRTGGDTIVAKLAGSDGAELWRQTTPGVGGGGRPFALAVDPDTDAAVVAGRVQMEATGNDLMVMKYTTDGAPAWSEPFILDGGGSAGDQANAVAVDGAGDVIVAGQIRTADAGAHFTVAKLSGVTGTPLWPEVRIFAGTAGGGRSTARAVLVDGAGDVLVAGRVSNVHLDGDSGERTEHDDIFLVKLAGTDGRSLWCGEIRGDAATGADDGLALGLLGAERVAVGGRTANGVDGDGVPRPPQLTIVAIDVDDSRPLACEPGDRAAADAWRFVIGGASEGTATALVTDAGGDVVAAGQMLDPENGLDFVTLKLNGATGALEWRRQLNGTAGGGVGGPGDDEDDDADVDQAFAVAVDAAGDAVAVGRLVQSGLGQDFVVSKMAGDTGEELWRLELNGTSDANDDGRAVAVDPATGDVVAAGRVRDRGDGSARRMIVLKLSGASGGDFPCGNGQVDDGEQCDDGNQVPGDGCRADCTREACGDGILDPAEGCDDGNTLDGDCCSSACAPRAEGASCDDGDPCTDGDRCTDGACGGVPLVCTPPGACQFATCERAGCVNRPLADGISCDDGEPCTVADVCRGGGCVGGRPTVCDDGDPCTEDLCVPGTGCSNAPVEGVGQVTCTFVRGVLGPSCPAVLPAKLRRQIARAERHATRAATKPRRKARRELKQTARRARKAERIAGKLWVRGALEAQCAFDVSLRLIELRRRAETLRREL